jgi:hypothetical protein
VAERTKATVLKTVGGATRPWVRIPLLPLNERRDGATGCEVIGMSMHTDMFTTTMAFNAFDKGVRDGGGAFVVQARHPDGRRWVDIRSFASKQDARDAIDHVVAEGHGPKDRFRIRHASREERG